jgi:hypothetical protein
MTETKPLPTMKCSCFINKYTKKKFVCDNCKVLLAHEQHYRKVIQEWVKFRAEALEKHCEEDVMMTSEKVMHNLIRLEAIQSLRGEKK